MKHISREELRDIAITAYVISKREVGLREQTRARASAFIQHASLRAVEGNAPSNGYLIVYKVEVNLGTKKFPYLIADADFVSVDAETRVHETKKFVIVEYTRLGVHCRKSIRKDNIIAYVW